MASPDSIRKGRRAPAFVPTPQWIVVAGLSAPAQALYTSLLAHANEEAGDGIVWPGMDTLAEMLGYNRRQSVRRYLAELVALNAVEMERVVFRGVWRNVYTVHELPPKKYAGPKSLKEFYARRDSDRKAAETAERRGMGATAHIPMGATAHQGMGATAPLNKTKPTRRSELDEGAAGGDNSVENPSAGHSPASKLGGRESKRIRITLPRNFDQLDDSAAMQKLVACAVKAPGRAGLELAPGAADRLGDTIRFNHEDGHSIRKIAEHVEKWLNLSAEKDPEFDWLIYWPKLAAVPDYTDPWAS